MERQSESELDVVVQQTGADVSFIKVIGEIDIATVPQFRATVGEISDQTAHLVIDMAGVRYMDSSGFGALLSMNKRLRPIGGSVHLVGCNDLIDRMLRITRLNTVFGIHATEADALTAIQSPSMKPSVAAS